MAANNIQALLAQADQQRGFPQGTMASLMQQESGGNAKYVNDPGAYHYGLNDQGQRIAGHTGKVSTARGPFGILESTGRDPGYGVQPLQNNTFDEHLRFAGDYLSARTKKAGGLEAGLSGYGEGSKYGKQVMARLGQQAEPGLVREPMGVVERPVENPTVVNSPQEGVAHVQVAARPAPLAEVDLTSKVPVQSTPQWDAFQLASAQQIAPQMLDYGRRQVAAMPVQQPDFSRFRAWGAKA